MKIRTSKRYLLQPNFLIIDFKSEVKIYQLQSGARNNQTHCKRDPV